jgi:hypothetical protein
MSGKDSLCRRLPKRRRDPQRSHRKPAQGDSREAARVIAPTGQLGSIGATQPSPTGSGGGNSEIIRSRSAEH